MKIGNREFDVKNETYNYGDFKCNSGLFLRRRKI